MAFLRPNELLYGSTWPVRQLLRDRRRNAQRLDLVCTMSDIAPGHGQTLWLVGMLPLVHTTSTKCQ
jgi:hypothetical protein